MTSSDNPWAEVFTQPQQKTTEGIIPSFKDQAKMLSEASEGKVKGLFSRTFDVNGTIVPALDLAESASIVASKNNLREHSSFYPRFKSQRCR